jgi:4-hydroxy-4-methyl-2-oxoglutarate aldolase
MTYVINDMPAQVAPALIEKCARAETATIGHLRHMGFVDKAVQNVRGNGVTVAGTAVTLAIPGQDSTLLHHVIQFLRPGDVLCIDRLGDTKHACLGGGVAAAIVATGCTTVVLDGPCTDLPEIEQYDLNVWSRGVAPITTRLYDVGGSFNVPISIGGSVVNPGDVVLADFSGVLVMPAAEAEADVDWALAKMESEPGSHKRFLAGERIGDISGASAKVAAKLGG